MPKAFLAIAVTLNNLTNTGHLFLLDLGDHIVRIRPNTLMRISKMY